MGRRFRERDQAPLSGSLPASGEREKKSPSMGGFMGREKANLKETGMFPVVFLNPVHPVHPVKSIKSERVLVIAPP
jgi:hypothetical protein